MKNIVSIMNAKGGVGKSTTTMILAETLAEKFDKKVLVVDADPQASISQMLIGDNRVKTRQATNKSIAGLVLKQLETTSRVDPFPYVEEMASDVIKATNNLNLIVGDIELAWIERQQNAIEDVSGFKFMQLLSERYDYVIIDCSPSVTTFTEKWLRSADYNIVPMRPDILSRNGFDLIRRMRDAASKDFVKTAGTLGTLITIRRKTTNEKHWVAKLKNDAELKCFDTEIPQSSTFQSAAEHSGTLRKFNDKYTNHSNVCKSFALEFLNRMQENV